ncbi:MAG: carbohydrate ABC transporter permease [Eubacterium sp.]|nr:carbohydrate ABC transporter permease [Eubacterium sp.]
MKKIKKIRPLDIIVNIPVVLFSITCIFPVFWLFYSSLKTEKEFSLDQIALPKSPQFDNFTKALEQANFDTYIWNSVLTSLITLVAVLVLSFTLGYFLTRYRFRGRSLIYTMLMAGMMIPVYGLIVPVFMQEKTLGILNTRASLLPIYTAIELPFAVMLINSYLGGISIELEEAAEVDGASMLQTMYQIMFPVCKPVMTTIGILTFMHAWNEFPFTRVLIVKEELKTIPVGLTYFTSQYTTNYTLLLAALTLSTLPLLLLYLFSFRNIMKGMMAGAVKG